MSADFRDTPWRTPLDVSERECALRQSQFFCRPSGRSVKMRWARRRVEVELGDEGRRPTAARPVEPWLWSPPEGEVGDLPTRPTIESLPLGKLSWRDTERLFLQLLTKQADVTFAKSYGVPGQDQQGIDVYARLPTDRGRSAAAASESSGGNERSSSRPYLVLQSRNVKRLTASEIDAAVTDFLCGSWPEGTSHFYYATTIDLSETKLDSAIRAASERLDKAGITLVPWGAEQINELLRDEPKLVHRFFHPAWVEAFCGASAADLVKARSLSSGDVAALRSQLRKLYRASFASLTALRPTPDSSEAPFMVLDVSPRLETLLGATALVENGGSRSSEERTASSLATMESVETGDGFGSSGHQVERVAASIAGRARPSLRSVRALLGDSGRQSGALRGVPADAWLSEGARSLLVGPPGAGKSSLLRFVAIDLLSSDPQSEPLQRRHGDRLPVWLPF